MDRSESRSCGEKIPYESFMLASNMLTLLQWAGKLTNRHETYKCQYCSNFHLGRGYTTFMRKAS